MPNEQVLQDIEGRDKGFGKYFSNMRKTHMIIVGALLLGAFIYYIKAGDKANIYVIIFMVVIAFLFIGSNVDSVVNDLNDDQCRVVLDNYLMKRKREGWWKNDATWKISGEVNELMTLGEDPYVWARQYGVLLKEGNLSKYYTGRVNVKNASVVLEKMSEEFTGKEKPSIKREIGRELRDQIFLHKEVRKGIGMGGQQGGGGQQQQGGGQY